MKKLITHHFVPENGKLRKCESPKENTCHTETVIELPTLNECEEKLALACLQGIYHINILLINLSPSTSRKIARSATIQPRQSMSTTSLTQSPGCLLHRESLLLTGLPADLQSATLTTSSTSATLSFLIC